MALDDTGQTWSAVVLTGGTAARLGGADKASIELGGLRLLDRALAAVSGADEVAVVGEPVPAPRPVRWVREQPPHGGPGAGLLAGLDVTSRPVVAVLAVDMPEVTSTTFERLLAALDDRSEGVVLVDGTGRRQPLCALYRRTALERARPADRVDEHGLPVRRLVGSMRLAEVPAVGAEAQDVDTWQDLHGLRTQVPRTNLDT